MDKNMIYENTMDCTEGSVRDDAPLFTLKDFPSAVGAVMTVLCAVALSTGALQVLSRVI